MGGRYKKLNMKASITFESRQYEVDFSKPIDLSFPLNHGSNNPKCFFAPDPHFEPVRTDAFVGSTQEGSPVNFYNVFFNPHGNGTHTECVGHISQEPHHIGEALTNFVFVSQLLHISPKVKKNGDSLITRKMLEKHLPKDDKDQRNSDEVKALIINTGIHGENKKSINFSGMNPTYISPKAMKYIRSLGFEHLLVDFPSVDREEDEGKLSAHKIFWSYPDKTLKKCTITELIFVPKGIKAGYYLLNMQVPNFSLDAAPSRPVIYNLNPL